MSIVKIRIQTLEDAKTRRQAMPEIEGKATEGKGITMCIMEDMTYNHKAGVSFVIENEDGTYTTKLITEGVMEMMIAAYKGALERFEDLKVQRLASQN